MVIPCHPWRWWLRHIGPCFVLAQMLECDCISRRLQDHESIEGGDAVVVVDVRGRIPAAACRDLERDYGVSGGFGTKFMNLQICASVAPRHP